MSFKSFYSFQLNNNIYETKPFLNLTDQNNIQKITETWITLIFNIRTV